MRLGSVSTPLAGPFHARRNDTQWPWPGVGQIPTEEADHAYRGREVVQPKQGIWVHRTRRGSNDVFVHISAVESAGLHSLNEGQKVDYELVPSRDGKFAAENLVVLD